MKKIIEKTYGYLKPGFFISSIIYFGFIKTFAVFILLLILRRYVMKFVFGVQELNATSQAFYSHKEHQRANLTGISLIENFDAEKIKNTILKRGIEQNTKLRSKLVKNFSGIYWKEVPLSEAYERVKIIEKPFKNEQEFLEYATKQSGNIIDFNELPYFIELASYKDESSSVSKGGLIIQFDHILSDGLGMVALICSMADNFKPEIFPSIMKNASNSFWFLVTDIFYEILSFFYMPFILYRLKTLKVASAPYMNARRPLGHIKHSVSKEYSLKDFDAIRKHKLKISFNDMIITVLSKSLNQICKDMGKTDITNILTLVPIGQDNLPTSAKDIILDNQSIGMLIAVPAVCDILNDSRLIANTFYKQLTNRPFKKAMSKFSAILLNLLVGKTHKMRMRTF
jgi:hypothetical protein